jgi:urocanate hydratase
VTSGLGGMSGAQPKAGNIAGCVTVCAEVNPKLPKFVTNKMGDEIHENLDELVARVRKAQENEETVSLAYLGNVVDVWENLIKKI